MVWSNSRNIGLGDCLDYLQSGSGRGDGRQLTVPVTVTDGAISFVLLQQTQPPPNAPTPDPEE